jgi:hypothetical protein
MCGRLRVRRAIWPAQHAKNSGGALAQQLRPVETRSSAGACYCVQRAPGAIADGPVLAKTHMTAKRAYLLAAEDDQNDACEDEMNALFEFLTTEPAICPTA